MKRQWRVRRQTCARPDGQLRWDRAYQALLVWPVTGSCPWGEPATADASSRSPMTEQERADADRRVCARLDDAPGGGAEH